MISYTRNKQTLKIGSLPENGLSPEDAMKESEAFDGAFDSDITTIRFDLSSTVTTHYGTMAYLKLCGGNLVARGATKVKFEFPGVDEKLSDALVRLGFFHDGTYIPSSKRQMEPMGVCETVGEALLDILEDTAKLLSYSKDLVETLFYYLRHPRKLSYGEILFYMDQTGANAVPIVMMICFLMGAILAFQGVEQLSRFGLSIFVSDLVGHSIVRELGPLMVAIICTGRAGSAFAAEIGTMKVNEELDAMTTMGLKPVYLLVMPKLVGLILVMPLLTLIGDFVGIVGGGVMAATSNDITLYSYFSRITVSLMPVNVMESLLKSVVFAFLIGAIGCFKGFDSESDAKGVGGATTSAVVSGVFLIVLADAGVTFIYPQIMRLLGIDY